MLIQIARVNTIQLAAIVMAQAAVSDVLSNAVYSGRKRLHGIRGQLYNGECKVSEIVAQLSKPFRAPTDMAMHRNVIKNVLTRVAKYQALGAPVTPAASMTQVLFGTADTVDTLSDDRILGMTKILDDQLNAYLINTVLTITKAYALFEDVLEMDGPYDRVSFTKLCEFYTWTYQHDMVGFLGGAVVSKLTAYNVDELRTMTNNYMLVSRGYLVKHGMMTHLLQKDHVSDPTNWTLIYAWFNINFVVRPITPEDLAAYEKASDEARAAAQERKKRQIERAQARQVKDTWAAIGDAPAETEAPETE